MIRLLNYGEVIMDNQYLLWQEKLKIEVISNKLIILYVLRSDNKVDRASINESGAEIIKAINGTRTRIEIIQYLGKKYNDSEKKVERYVDEYLKELVKELDLHLLFCDKKVNVEIQCVTSNIYPRVASIEITNSCNLKCLHCYGSFSPENHVFMNFDSAKKILNDLNNVNTFLIELTGGECLLNKDFIPILMHALSLNFMRISILTNGVLLTDEIIDLIIKNKDRINIQIDLHSLDDEYTFWFTGKRNIVKTIQNNIKKLASADVSMRVVTIVTKNNINELNTIADWLEEQNVKYYSVSPVVRLGRAINSDASLLLDRDEEYECLNNSINRISLKMKTDKGEFSETTNDNCGCVSSHITIDARGNVKLCTMDNQEFLKNVFFNALETDVQKWYDSNQELLHKLMKLKAPKVHSKYCSKCENKTFCANCFLRAIIVNYNTDKKCNWYKHELDKAIKKVIEG